MTDPEPPRKQARLDCFLLPKKNNLLGLVSVDVASAAGSDLSGIKSATTVDPTAKDTELDSAACVDIRIVQELRRTKHLTVTDKIRFHTGVLKVSSDFKLPVEETTKQKYYLRHHHLTGGGNTQHDYFYFSPKLQGVLCLACLPPLTNLRIVCANLRLFVCT